MSLAFAALIGAAPALAAPLTTSDPTQVLPPAPPPSSEPLIVHAGPATGGPEDVTPKLVLNAVRFDGVKALPPDALHPAWADFVGKTVSLGDLRAIGRRAEAIYAKAGYPFVAVILRVQQVDQGVVGYDVVEGHISDLTVLGSSQIARRQATAALSPLVNKTPLSIGDVEFAYQNAKAVPGLSISGRLRRGSEAGGMDLVVATQRTDWRAYANVNNLYADSVGPWGLLLGAEVNGLTKYGDKLSAQVYTSLPTGRQLLVRGAYSLRLNDWGTTVSLSGLWGEANPKGDLGALAIAQNVASIRLDVAQPLWELANSNLQADLAIEGSDQRTDVFSIFHLSNDRLRDLSLSLTGEVRGRYGRLAMNGELHQNVDILGASHAGELSLSRVGGDPEATIFRAGAEAESATFHYVRLDARLDSQYTDRPLVIPDQYSAGNLTVGRGYAPGAALGDRAVGGSAELRFGPFDVAHQVQLEPFVFTDILALWNIGAAPFQYRELRSWGGGVRMQLNGVAHLDLLCAVPEVPPLGLGDRTPSPMVLMNLTVGLNDAFSLIHRKLMPRSGS